MSEIARNQIAKDEIDSTPNQRNIQLYITTTDPDSKISNHNNGEFNFAFIEPHEKIDLDNIVGTLEIKNDINEPPKTIDDAWDIQEMAGGGSTTPWSDLTGKEKAIKVLIGIGKVFGLLGLLYFFVCSLDLLSLGFRLVGGRTTGEIFRQSDIIKNPVVGVMIGILTTVLVQSSSTSTSIIVSMVSADFLTVQAAIPIIMGSNIGTSITNTIVSLTQAGDRSQFRRAFAGATVHDMFNWLSVIVLLIIEVTTGYLFHLTSAVMGSISKNSTAGGEIELLGVITKPFVNLIVQLDKSVLECWSAPNCTHHDNSSLIKEFCKPKHSPMDSDLISSTPISTPPKCEFLFAGTSLNDAAAGGIILVASLIVLCTCLILIVKLLNSVLQGQIAVVIKKTLNADIPYVPWITGYIALVVGAVMTFLVQSSSVFTSALTPLVGVGVISIERVYPLTLGSNIGTTSTALIAALAVTGKSFNASLQVALCHLFFNVSGILLFYPIPFMRFPIRMAKFLGQTTANYRWFAILYMILMFLILPLIVMGLSFIGSAAVIAFAALVFALLAFVLAVNVLRKKKPSVLPAVLRNWEFLPLPLRSLEPYDKVFTSLACCKKLRSKTTEEESVPANRKDLEIPMVIEGRKSVQNENLGYTNTAFVN